MWDILEENKIITQNNVVLWNLLSYFNILLFLHDNCASGDL